jgi:hypothetical protein
MESIFPSEHTADTVTAHRTHRTSPRLSIAKGSRDCISQCNIRTWRTGCRNRSGTTALSRRRVVDNRHLRVTNHSARCTMPSASLRREGVGSGSQCAGSLLAGSRHSGQVSCEATHHSRPRFLRLACLLLSTRAFSWRTSVSLGFTCPFRTPSAYSICVGAVVGESHRITKASL